MGQIFPDLLSTLGILEYEFGQELYRPLMDDDKGKVSNDEKHRFPDLWTTYHYH